MGFSLELFFEELNSLLATKDSDVEKLYAIRNAIEKGQRYAQDCNVIPKPVKTFMPELHALDEFYIFDTETTGFENTAEICQLGAISSSGETVINRVVKITIDMPEGAYNIHGITTLECKSFGQDWSTLFTNFCKEIKDKHLVAWNLGYDLRLLKQTCEVHGVDYDLFQPAGVHCAMKAYAEYFEVQRGREKLVNAANNLGIDFEGNHDAIVDCEMVLGVMKGIWQKQ